MCHQRFLTEPDEDVRTSALRMEDMMVPDEEAFAEPRFAERPPADIVAEDEAL